MKQLSAARYLILACALAIVATSMQAQTKSTADSEKAAAKDESKPKFRPRLPNNYGKIGVSDKQRQEIYSIQRKYFDELQVLVERIKVIKSERDSQIYDVLTPEQKAALAKLQEKPKKTATKKTEKKSAS